MLQNAANSLLSGAQSLTLSNALMIAVGCVLLYLAIRHGFEPLLLIPIGFGAILVNLPLTGLMDEGTGLLWYFYSKGILTEIFPCLIFVGIGAMIDFTPLLENPKLLLLGAAGQLGIFLTVYLALQLGFSRLDACSIGIIGACDGPTAIYVTAKYAPYLLGAVSIAAYSYMSLVPLIQPPLMRLFTTQKERAIIMATPARKTVSQNLLRVFPIAVTLVTCIIAPFGAPLIGMLMLGNFLRESGVVGRLAQSAQNEIVNSITLLLGISIGATMLGDRFLQVTTLKIFGLGLIAIALDTIGGIFFGKLMCRISGGKINPLIGAAGISAFPMSARVVQMVGQKANPQNFLLMHAIGVNAGGQIASIMAAAVMLSILKGLGLA